LNRFWNYRVVLHTYQNGLGEIEELLEIHEAHYEGPDGEPDPTHPHAITTDGATVRGETIEELRASLHRMLECLEKPIIDYRDF
jgi:hypothetical protein